jgi:hypothetical protein
MTYVALSSGAAPNGKRAEDAHPDAPLALLREGGQGGLAHLPRRALGPPGLRRLVLDDGVHAPFAGNAFKLMRAAVLEYEL